MASKDAEISAKAAQVDSLEGPVRIAEEGKSLRSATIHEHSTQLRAAVEAPSSTEITLRSVESQLQVVCAFESSLQEEVGRLESDKTGLEDQCELAV